MCKAATKDNSVTGSAYREMVHNIISKSSVIVYTKTSKTSLYQLPAASNLEAGFLVLDIRVPEFSVLR